MAKKNYQHDTPSNLAYCDGDWDKSEAKAAVFRWATGRDGRLDPRKARRAFLMYDADRPTLRGSYKLPIATVQRGRLVVVGNAVRNALSRLSQVQGAKRAVRREARVTAREYLDKINASGDECSFDLGSPNPFLPFEANKALKKIAPGYRFAPEEVPGGESQWRYEFDDELCQTMSGQLVIDPDTGREFVLIYCEGVPEMLSLEDYMDFLDERTDVVPILNPRGT